MYRLPASTSSREHQLNVHRPTCAFAFVLTLSDRRWTSSCPRKWSSWDRRLTHFSLSLRAWIKSHTGSVSPQVCHPKYSDKPGARSRGPGLGPGAPGPRPARARGPDPGPGARAQGPPYPIHPPAHTRLSAHAHRTGFGRILVVLGLGESARSILEARARARAPGPGSGPRAPGPAPGPGPWRRRALGPVESGALRRCR